MAAPVTAASEAAHDAAGAFPPFDSTYFPSQLLWLAISFGALYWLMSRIALPRIESILADRQAAIARDLDEASQLQAKADAAAANYEQALADAKEKAQNLARATHETLAAQADEKRRTLESDLQAKLAAAEAQISTTKTKAMTNVADIARAATASIVEKILGRPADRDVVDKAVETIVKS
jgi:F-type H+-transporting ATPase subunit b